MSGLIKNVANGDVTALEKIFMGMKDIIYSFAMTYVRNFQCAEDVLQETIIEVWKSARNYRSTGSARAWVLVVARNTAVDMIRRESHETTVDEDFIESEPENNVAAGYESGELAQLLEQLPPFERRLILLHIVAGLKHRETAKLLNLPLGTVCRKYSESIEKLRRIYNA